MHIYLTRPSPGVGGGVRMPSGEEQKPGGWNRIHLIVEELDGTIAALKSAGCRFRSDVIQGTGGKQILLEDPSGNLVELFQANTVAYRAPGSSSKAMPEHQAALRLQPSKPQKAHAQRAGVATVGVTTFSARLGPPEIGQHVLRTPARARRVPAFEVEWIATNIHEPVDR
jgi:hypothetical protein